VSMGMKLINQEQLIRLMRCVVRVILEICYESRGSWNENPEGRTRR
jgi:hypothetical protein